MLEMNPRDSLRHTATRCPNGKELMKDATIPMMYVGGGPYIIRKSGKKVSLGDGSYMATIQILGTKFGFKTTLTPAKSVSEYMGNVSFQKLIYLIVKCLIRYCILPYVHEGLKKGC